MGQVEKDISISSDHSKNKHYSGKSGTTDAEKAHLKQAADDKLEEAKFFNLFVTTSYIISDMKKKPRSYKIGVFTVTLTVTFCIVLYCVLDVMPVMFLKLSQNQVGESDLVYTALSPKNVSYTADNYMYDQGQIAVRNSITTEFYIPLVNCSKVIEETKNNTDFEGFTPRWFGVADFANTTNTKLTVSGVIMILDTQREVQIGLGRDFTKTILGPGQGFLTNSALKYLQVEPNGVEKVQLVIDIRKYLNLMLNTNLVLTSNDITVISQKLGLNLNLTQSFTVRLSDYVNADRIKSLTGIDIAPTINNAVTTVTSSQITDFLLNNQETLFVIRLDFQIVEGFDSPNGKFLNSLGNVMVVDSKYILTSFISGIQSNFQNTNGGALQMQALQAAMGNITQLANVNISDYAFEVDAVFKNREKYYLSTPADNQGKILATQNRLGLRMNVQAVAPVATALEGFYFLYLFLQSTFLIIVFFMALLSVMLIYSLMISDVDEKTYEMGMLRALGLRTVSLVQLIIIQSLVFSLPGVIIGLLIAFLINVCLRFYIFSYSLSYTTYLITVGAALIGVCLGFFMPLLSNIWAIKRALGKKIRDSLDIFHTGINDVYVQIIKLESFGFSPFEIILGITLLVMGVLTYYMAPAAFLFNRIDLFFFILNLILVGMIIGLAMICFLLFQYIQTGMIYLITWILRFDIKLRPLVLKNMNESHKKRNLKTSLLFTIALAYLVFGGSSLLLIGGMIVGIFKNFVGCDIFVSSMLSQNALPEADIRGYLNLETAKKDKSRIVDYSFRGIALHTYLGTMFGYRVSSQIKSGGDFPFARSSLFPVEKSYIDSTLIDFFIPQSNQPGMNYVTTRGKPDYIKAVYSNDATDDFGGNLDKYQIYSKNLSSTATVNNPYSVYGLDPTAQIKVILPLGIKDVLSVKGGDTVTLSVSTTNTNRLNNNYRLLIRGLASKMPGFFFASYKQVSFFLQGIISFDQAQFITKVASRYNENNYAKYQNYTTDRVYSTYSYYYPKNILCIRAKDSVSQSDRDIFVNELGGKLTSNDMIIIDLNKFLTTIDSTLILLQLFIIVVGAIAFIITFFLLVVSTTSNIRENMWEFGVLRAIGIKKHQIIRIYLYESLAVTLTACILGLIIGFLLALTLSMQFNLFLELPFFIAFPYELTFTMLGLAIITTIIGTVIPLNNVNNQTIASILKSA